MLDSSWLQSLWERFHLAWVLRVVLFLAFVGVVYLLGRRFRFWSFSSTDKKQRDLAKGYLASGEHRLAAETFLKMGELEPALKAFLQAKQYARAGHVAEQLSRLEEAAEYYERAQDIPSAAAVFRKARAWDRAAEMYHRANQPIDAAKLYEEAGQYLKAARLFREIGFIDKAASLFWQAGVAGDAIDCLLAMVPNARQGFTEEQKGLFLSGAERCKKDGRLLEAARLFRAAGSHENAGRAFAEAGAPREAAASMEQAGQLEMAAALYKGTGQADEWLNVLERMRAKGLPTPEYGQALCAAGFFDRAASFYLESGNQNEAVAAFIKGGQLQDAAALHARQGKWLVAAGLLEEAGEFTAARENYLKGGNRSKAAELALKAGLFFEAGMDFVAIGDKAKAVEAWQRLPKDHAEFTNVSRRMAQYFAQMGELDLAEKMLRRVTDGLTIGFDNLENFYTLAKILEESREASKREEAKRLYGDIILLQYNFRDARERHAALAAQPQVPNLGKYRLLTPLSKGGMAEVFKAKTVGADGFEKLVAIKRILPHLASDDNFITMFTNEAKIAALLTHSNIAQTLDFGKIGDEYFIAIEYIHGKDLKALLKRCQKSSTRIPLPLAIFIAIQACQGLDYAHRKRGSSGQELQIVHRDISPQNILVSFEGEVKIIDFGIAKSFSQVTHTRAGVLKGKASYMSPEQISGQPLDRRSDLFSLGVVLWEMLAGERLFSGDDSISVIEKVRAASIDPPSSRNPEVPQVLDQVVLRAVARDREKRFGSAAEVQQRLEKILEDLRLVVSQKHLATYLQNLFKEEIDQEAVATEQVTLPPVTKPTKV